MLDIIGNIKVNEENPNRVRYLLASLKSFRFLKNDCTFYLHLEGASDRLLHEVTEWMAKLSERLLPVPHFLVTVT